MRKHSHEEERRTRKLRKLLDRIDGALTASFVSEKEVTEALRRNAESLKNNQAYQNWKSRN